MCRLLRKADASPGDRGSRGPALGHTGASEGKHSWHHPSVASVPDRCPVPQGTGSNHGMQRAGSDNGCQASSVLMHRVLVVLPFVSSKQLLGKYPSDRKLSKASAQTLCSCAA